MKHYEVKVKAVIVEIEHYRVSASSQESANKKVLKHMKKRDLEHEDVEIIYSYEVDYTFVKIEE